MRAKVMPDNDGSTEDAAEIRQSFEIYGNEGCQKKVEPTSGGGLESYRMRISFSLLNYITLGQGPKVKYLAL